MIHHGQKKGSIGVIAPNGISGISEMAGVIAFIGFHASVGPHGVMAVGVIWFGGGVGVERCAGDCVCVISVGTGVGVNVAFCVVLPAILIRAE